MIKLRDAYKARDAWSESQLKETFEFKNKQASLMINDCNYWSFGEVGLQCWGIGGDARTHLEESMAAWKRAIEKKS